MITDIPASLFTGYFHLQAFVLLRRIHWYSVDNGLVRLRESWKQHRGEEPRMRTGLWTPVISHATINLEILWYQGHGKISELVKWKQITGCVTFVKPENKKEFLWYSLRRRTYCQYSIDFQRFHSSFIALMRIAALLFVSHRFILLSKFQECDATHFIELC